MFKLITTLAVLLTGILANAQNTEVRKSNTATRIEVQNGIEVIFTQQDTPSLMVETDKPEKLRNVITEFNGKTLKIYLKDKDESLSTAHPYAKLKVYVGQKEISSFKAIAGASIKFKNDLILPEVSVTLGSGGSFQGDIKAVKRCSITTTSGSAYTGKIHTSELIGSFKSGSSIKIHGYAVASKINTTSGATFQSNKLVTDDATINAQQNSSVAISVTTSLHAKTDNSSSIVYFGDPKKIEMDENSYAIYKN